ncbi:MAG: peptidase M61 [Novosphingobium sp.]|nr:M61 family metallopeptidase [Novosphingobium sp.]
MRSLKFAAALLAAFALPATAQEAAPSGPTAVPIVRTVPDAVDTPYPGGTMQLDIDASDNLRGVYRVTQTIPVAPGTGSITLLYPQWLPGHHAPRGPLAELVDLKIYADGRQVPWTRDPVEVYAFHVDLPSGTRELTARFLHTSPLQPVEGRVTMTPDMLNLQWEKVSLYPAGHYVRRIRVKPSLTLPRGWTAAVALDGQRASGSRVSWDETDYETLIDSPVFAGAYFRRWELGGKVGLNVVADDPGFLNLSSQRLGNLAGLAMEAQAIFGRAPFDRYEFLVALSDRLGRIGLEHLRSSENRLKPASFVEWEKLDWGRNVLAHELVHSWNGKFRRPEGLWTPDYRHPMQDGLLWVYEGQTQFWGWVLAARSGLQTKETVLGMIATSAGFLAEEPGRDWRSVADTTLDPIVAARKPKPYVSLARPEDYYNEGALIWLEADQVIRAGTGGRKGLDDFARAFFSHPGGALRHSTYGFDDIVAALNSIYRYDWAQFLRSRIDEPGRAPPLAGIERAGYRLVWKQQPNSYDQARMDDDNSLNLYHSLGISVDRDGTVTDSRWGGPAFEAGIVTGAKIVAVDTLAFSQDILKRAIMRAAEGGGPIDLLVRRADRYETVPVRYDGGLRWPWLERQGRKEPAPLDQLLAPRRNASSQ